MSTRRYISFGEYIVTLVDGPSGWGSQELNGLINIHGLAYLEEVYRREKEKQAGRAWKDGRALASGEVHQSPEEVEDGVA